MWAGVKWFLLLLRTTVVNFAVEQIAARLDGWSKAVSAKAKAKLQRLKKRYGR